MINRGLTVEGAPKGFRTTGHAEQWRGLWIVELAKDGQTLHWDISSAEFRKLQEQRAFDTPRGIIRTTGGRGFVTIVEGVGLVGYLDNGDRLELKSPDDVERYTRIGGFESFICSSTVDFPEEYGMARDEVRAILGLEN